MGNVLYWTACIAGASWLVFWLFAFARNGEFETDVLGSLAISFIPAMVLYAVGWALRYILADKRGF